MELIGLIGVPFAASLLLFLIPFYGRYLALSLSLIPLILLHAGGVGHGLNYPWISALSINFHLAIDALSFVFLFLTCVIVPISIWVADKNYPNSFYGLILLTQALLIGFFTAQDLVLFTVFWEAMLFPLYFIIAIWGKEEKRKAALQFLLYMIAGSTLMIVGVLAIYFSAGSFDFATLAKNTYAPWILAVFLLAFAVKTPLFPFHGWLPNAYYQAPVTGTILLAGLLSKAGIYGIARVALPLFPDLMKAWSPVLITFATIGIFYGAFAAWRQTDYKRLIAYSSLSHVNFILLGLFVAIQPGLNGAILQAFNHGITITALFIVAWWLEQRIGTTKMQISGLAKFMPYLAWLTLFFVLSSVALPGTNSFVGELLILLGSFKWSVWLAAIVVLSVIFSAVYMLRFMQKVYFEGPTFFRDSWVDIGLKEYLVVTPLIFFILWVGLYPAPLLKHIELISLWK